MFRLLKFALFLFVMLLVSIVFVYAYGHYFSVTVGLDVGDQAILFDLNTHKVFSLFSWVPPSNDLFMGFEFSPKNELTYIWQKRDEYGKYQDEIVSWMDKSGRKKAIHSGLGASWSPDGRLIVFNKDILSPQGTFINESEIYVFDTQTESLEQVPLDLFKYFCWDAELLADNQTVISPCAAHGEDSMGLYMIDVKGKYEPYLVMAIDFPVQMMRVSPNGQWLAFEYTDAEAGRENIALTAISEEDHHYTLSPLLPFAQVPLVGKKLLGWSSDSQHLMFAREYPYGSVGEKNDILSVGDPQLNVTDIAQGFFGYDLGHNISWVDNDTVVFRDFDGNSPDTLCFTKLDWNLKRECFSLQYQPLPN